MTMGNILTFDIEEWYIEKHFNGERKEKYRQYDELLDWILNTLEKNNTKATFFCVGQLAVEFPNVLKRIANAGHEIGSHSNKHLWVNKMTPEEFAEDTRIALEEIENMIGEKVKSFRAPAFSIGKNNDWAFDILAENGIEYDDNDSRAVFYARGVLETVKKLRWCPDVIHCHGWMTALAPLYIKKAYKDEPSFRDAKVVFSVYEDDFKSTLSDDFAAKLMLKGISKKDLGDLKEPVDYAALCKLAVDYSDGVIQNSEKVDESIIEYARQSGKLVLDYQNPENYADACNEFYDQVWDATANEEE